MRGLRRIDLLKEYHDIEDTNAINYRQRCYALSVSMICIKQFFAVLISIYKSW